VSTNVSRSATVVALGVLAVAWAGACFYGLILLWSWDASFGNGGGANENVADAPQRVLLALFSLSVIAYLATPLIARALPERDGSPR
jgi:hypothetical protein